MFFFSDASIPKHLAEKISIPYEIVSPNTFREGIIVDCKSIWGDIHHENTQHLIHYYSRTYPQNKTFLFLITDDCEPFHVPNNVRVYRTSLLKSAKSPNEYLLPYIWEATPDPFTPLKRTSETPSIGFCGLISPYRTKTLQLFEKDTRFETHYILRNAFWGGKPHDPTVIREYQENMRNTHFNICNRGKGNFAIRFYQTLAAGRIPIVLNTDMILPFESPNESPNIDWNQIIVLANTEEELVEKTLLFWKTRNIEDAQRKCRQIYETFFEGTKFLDSLLSSSCVNNIK